jgi:serine/threonine protein kinase
VAVAATATSRVTVRDVGGGRSTVAAPPDFRRERPTWGLQEGDEIAPGRCLLRRIGSGRRYEAMLMWDEHRLAVLVAKVLRPDQARDPLALHDLEREAALLERLAHPVVVRGFGAVLDGRFPHLVLEHLDGPTLHELLARDGTLAIEQLLPLALHVASALHYLAAEGVVHLDVKPSNIVMGGPPRLIDLSVARTLDEAAALRSPIGTDAYMAPEQCAPDGRVGPPADVFGLAATLYSALTGTRPFPPCGERFPQLTGKPAKLPRRTPRALADAVFAGLERDPAARPTAAELAHALEPLVAALPRRMTLGRH